jgi:hypothetical protein
MPPYGVPSLTVAYAVLEDVMFPLALGTAAEPLKFPIPDEACSELINSGFGNLHGWNSCNEIATSVA